MEQEKNIVSTVSQLSPDGREVIQAVPQEAENRGEATNTGTEGNRGSSELVSYQITMKRKRGRPRKYDQLVEKTTLLASPPSGFPSSLSVTCEKRPRGRPRGSGRMQLLASLGGYLAETAGGSFTPHVLIVQAGEDIVSKILAFTQKGYKAVCVVSATGAVSSVVIRQPGSSGGILRYEGRFEILTLSGSFTFGETTGKHRKNGMLSVSLAKPDGRVFGGGIVGPLIASAPIQLIVGSFKQNISKELKQLKQRRESAESSSAACAVKIGNNSEIVRINSTQNNNNNHNNGGDQETCRTPTSAVMELPTNEAAAVNQDVMNSADPLNNFELSDQITTMSISQI